MSARDKSIYCVQWVESGLEREIQSSNDDAFSLDRAEYFEGAKRWFNLFYNSATSKFINYFEQLIETEKRLSLRLPEDIQDGSYSTAFASGVTPQDLIVPLAPNSVVNDNKALVASAKATLKPEFDIWAAQPEIAVHRKCLWKISHMPSLQDISASEYCLITKSEGADHDKIVAVFYDKTTHIETRRLDIGGNEKIYPTDCVSTMSRSGDILYVALNKRTKSSEPHAAEIHAYDLTSNLEIGFITKQASTCRFLCQATENYLGAFMLNYCLIL